MLEENVDMTKVWWAIEHAYPTWLAAGVYSIAAEFGINDDAAERVQKKALKMLGYEKNMHIPQSTISEKNMVLWTVNNPTSEKFNVAGMPKIREKFGLPFRKVHEISRRAMDLKGCKQNSAGTGNPSLSLSKRYGKAIPKNEKDLESEGDIRSEILGIKQDIKKILKEAEGIKGKIEEIKGKIKEVEEVEGEIEEGKKGFFKGLFS